MDLRQSSLLFFLSFFLLLQIHPGVSIYVPRIFQGPKSDHIWVGGAFEATTSDSDDLVGVAVYENEEWISPNSQSVAFALGKINGWGFDNVHNELYIGGLFAWAGGLQVNNIASYSSDGTWRKLAEGVDDMVNFVMMNGSTPIIGGVFSYAIANTSGGVNPQQLNGIAAFENDEWVNLGSQDFSTDTLLSLAVNGSNLYAFYQQPDETGFSVQVYDTVEQSWSPLLNTDNDPAVTLSAMAIGGNYVYLSGLFSKLYGIEADNLARWNGTDWEAVPGCCGSRGGVPYLFRNNVENPSELVIVVQEGSGVGYVYSIYVEQSPDNWTSAATVHFATPFNDMVVTNDWIFIGGLFDNVSGVESKNVAKFNRQTQAWESMGDNFGALNYTVRSLIYGNGNLYVWNTEQISGGYYTNSSLTIYNVGDGLWDPPLLSPLLKAGFIEEFFIDKEQVWVGGYFTAIGNLTAYGIAAFNKSPWGPLTGIDIPLIAGRVTAIAGTETDLFIGGNFIFPRNDSLSPNVVGLDRTTGEWYALDDGIEATEPQTASCVPVSDLEISSNGQLLWIGGCFNKNLTSGDLFSSVVVWNITGRYWTTLGPGKVFPHSPGPQHPSIYSIDINDTSVYVAGSYRMESNDTVIVNLVKWNIAQDVMEPIPSYCTRNCGALQVVLVIDETVYIGGTFSLGTSTNPGNIAMLSGNSSWQPLQLGLNGGVNALAYDSVKNFLIAGGAFTSPIGPTVGSNNCGIAIFVGGSWVSLNLQTLTVWQSQGGVYAVAVDYSSTSSFPVNVWFYIAIGFALVIIIGIIALAAHRASRNRDQSGSESLSINSGGYNEKSSLLVNDHEHSDQISYSDLKILGAPIGMGASGVVNKAELNGTLVAVKIFVGLGASSQSSNFNATFEKEIEVLRHLRHPNIVLYMGCCLQPPCLITEFVKKGSLQDMAAEHPELLTPKKQTKIAYQCALGMAYLHGQRPPIIHRDLKSGNVLLDDNFNVKICDFGVSRPMAVNTMTFRIGTTRWVAPEILRTTAGNNYTLKADVYSYGVVLWEIIAKAIPFADKRFEYEVEQMVLAGTRPEIPAGCPPLFAQLMKQCRG